MLDGPARVLVINGQVCEPKLDGLGGRASALVSTVLPVCSKLTASRAMPTISNSAVMSVRTNSTDSTDKPVRSNLRPPRPSTSPPRQSLCRSTPPECMGMTRPSRSTCREPPSDETAPPPGGLEATRNTLASTREHSQYAGVEHMSVNPFPQAEPSPWPSRPQHPDRSRWPQS